MDKLEQLNPFTETTTAAIPRQRILLVDDDTMLLVAYEAILNDAGFTVTSAANVNDALKHISSHPFDILLSDLHMPNVGDGLTVVSAMKNANPQALTLIISGYPEMRAAAEAILSQTDAILLKPMNRGRLIEEITTRLSKGKGPLPIIENVAAILEREVPYTIADWMKRVDADTLITRIEMSDPDRSAHLPRLLADLVHRLRNPLPLGSRALVSDAAANHGTLRREQGYSAAMVVEESRMLQVSIFQTLQNNLSRVDFSLLLMGVMTIADEVDSQLAQQMSSYAAESVVDNLPILV
jgi:CheY-like chemotaxis protein